jgi:hypothetical protein
MSRSVRSAPFVGLGGAGDSEALDKRHAARRWRRAVRVWCARGCPGIEPHAREFGNSLYWAKDGRLRFDPDRQPELRRK